MEKRRIRENFISIYASLSLQESYGPWVFWHLQPIETAPRMPVLVLHCLPDISVIFRHWLCPLLPDWSHLSETSHVGRLPQSSIGWVYFSKHDAWTKILKSSCLQHLRSRWYALPVYYIDCAWRMGEYTCQHQGWLHRAHFWCSKMWFPGWKLSAEVGGWTRCSAYKARLRVALIQSADI